jgi:hypothetical protein
MTEAQKDTLAENNEWPASGLLHRRRYGRSRRCVSVTGAREGCRISPRFEQGGLKTRSEFISGLELSITPHEFFALVDTWFLVFSLKLSSRFVVAAATSSKFYKFIAVRDAPDFTPLRLSPAHDRFVRGAQFCCQQAQ